MELESEIQALRLQKTEAEQGFNSSKLDCSSYAGELAAQEKQHKTLLTRNEEMGSELVGF